MDPHGRIVKPMTRSELEVAASNVRRGFGLEPISRVSMLPLLEHVLDEIIPEFEFNVVENWELGGAEAVTDVDRPIITMAERTYHALRRADGRARFTAAHEVGHLVLHTGMPHSYGFGAHSDPTTCPEWQADYFAAAFLMPRDGFRHIRTVAEAVKAFGVSRDAALCRSRKLGIRLEDSRSAQLFQQRRLRMMFAPPITGNRKKERRP